MRGRARVRQVIGQVLRELALEYLPLPGGVEQRIGRRVPFVRFDVERFELRCPQRPRVGRAIGDVGCAVAMIALGNRFETVQSGEKFVHRPRDAGIAESAIRQRDTGQRIERRPVEAAGSGLRGLRSLLTAGCQRQARYDAGGGLEETAARDSRHTGAPVRGPILAACLHVRERTWRQVKSVLDWNACRPRL